MKKTTIKSLLFVLIMGTISQGALQAMDQNNHQNDLAEDAKEDQTDCSCLAPVARALKRLTGKNLIDFLAPRNQAQQNAVELAQEQEDQADYSSLAPVARALKRLTGRDIIDLSPRNHAQQNAELAQDELPREQADQQNQMSESCIVNAWNSALSLPAQIRDIVRRIGALNHNHQFLTIIPIAAIAANSVPAQIRDIMQRIRALNPTQLFIFTAIIPTAILAGIYAHDAVKEGSKDYHTYIMQTTNHPESVVFRESEFIRRLLTERRFDDLRAYANMLISMAPIANICLAIYLLYNALHIAESYHPGMQLPDHPVGTIPQLTEEQRQANNIVQALPIVINPQQAICSVCLDNIERGVQLHCNHIYHPHCITQWFTQQLYEGRHAPSCYCGHVVPLNMNNNNN